MTEETTYPPDVVEFFNMIEADRVAIERGIERGIEQRSNEDLPPLSKLEEKTVRAFAAILDDAYMLIKDHETRRAVVEAVAWSVATTDLAYKVLSLEPAEVSVVGKAPLDGIGARAVDQAIDVMRPYLPEEYREPAPRKSAPTPAPIRREG